MKHAKNNKKNPAIIDGDMTVGNIYTPCVVASGSWPAGDQELTKFGSTSNVGPDPTTWSSSRMMIGFFIMKRANPKGFLVVFGIMQILTDGEWKEKQPAAAHHVRY